jgi:hypothetical protein
LKVIRIYISPPTITPPCNAITQYGNLSSMHGGSWRRRNFIKIFDHFFYRPIVLPHIVQLYDYDCTRIHSPDRYTLPYGSGPVYRYSHTFSISKSIVKLTGAFSSKKLLVRHFRTLAAHVACPETSVARGVDMCTAQTLSCGCGSKRIILWANRR